MKKTLLTFVMLLFVNPSIHAGVFQRAEALLKTKLPTQVAFESKIPDNNLDFNVFEKEYTALNQEIDESLAIYRDFDIKTGYLDANVKTIDALLKISAVGINEPKEAEKAKQKVLSDYNLKNQKEFDDLKILLEKIKSHRYASFQKFRTNRRDTERSIQSNISLEALANFLNQSSKIFDNRCTIENTTYNPDTKNLSITINDRFGKETYIITSKRPLVLYKDINDYEQNHSYEFRFKSDINAQSEWRGEDLELDEVSGLRLTLNDDNTNISSFYLRTPNPSKKVHERNFNLLNFLSRLITNDDASEASHTPQNGRFATCLKRGDSVIAQTPDIEASLRKYHLDRPVQNQWGQNDKQVNLTKGQ